MRTQTARLERVSCPDSAAEFGVTGARSIRMLKLWLDYSAVTILGQLQVAGLPRSCFRHDRDMLELKKIVEFRGFLFR